MLFNSLEFLILFLPTVLAISFLFKGTKLIVWICCSSLFFYAYAGHAWFLIPMVVSAVVDFWAGKNIEDSSDLSRKKKVLCLSVIANLGLLCYFKYSGLLLDTAHFVYVAITGLDTSKTFLSEWRVILPAGISFYTFQTMSYVIDIYRGDAKREKNFFTYFSFISFFPHLVAGPLTRHNQLIPQLKHIAEFGIKPRWRAGIFMFAIGLAKKSLIADRIANSIDPLIHDIGSVGAVGAWMAVIGYAFQIYFDFSGYSDMAIGLGRMMQIELPINFDSPYKSLSPSDFWKRWHITLSQWLRDYLYISLGGNRTSLRRQKFNLMCTMVLGGLWHGASWNFLLWGAYHGSLLLVYHQWSSIWDSLGVTLRRCLMFFLVCFGWILFRAPTFATAVEWYKSLLLLNGLSRAENALGYLPLMLAFCVWIVFFTKNSNQIEPNNFSLKLCALLGALAGACMLLMNYSSKFLYFQF